MIQRDLRFTARIQGSAEAIFDLVADMPNYSRWLPDSSAFSGTINVTPYPVRLGTTYLDAGPIEKPGVVTEFDRPRHISFQHTVQVRQSLLHTDVKTRIRYTFEPDDGAILSTAGLLSLLTCRVSPGSRCRCSFMVSGKKTFALSPHSNSLWSHLHARPSTYFSPLVILQKLSCVCRQPSVTRQHSDRNGNQCTE